MKKLLLILVSILFVGCAQKSTYEDIADVKNLSQKMDSYTQNFDTSKLPKDYFTSHYKKFDERFFKPWHIEKLSFDKNEAYWAYNLYPKKTMYGLNHQPIPKEWFDKVIDNSNLDSYNTNIKKAITINNSSLKNFPTNNPIFYSFEEAGEGYPFDYNQNSGIKANTPIIISHYSKDMAFVFVESSYALGWVRVQDIALVSDEFVSKFETSDKVVVTKDNLTIQDNKNNFLYYAKLSTIFIKDGNIKSVKKDINNYAYFETILPKENGIENFPISFNEANIKKLGNEFIGELYGWGELLDNRDCSATTRDFLAPFGVWLPRNSASQKVKGKYIDVSKLSNEDKEKLIIKEGIPFVTTIYLNGHIMLYIGVVDDKVAVLQSTWGVKTTKPFGGNGRKIIGKTIISTLYAGKELDNVDSDKLLINRIEGFTIH